MTSGNQRSDILYYLDSASFGDRLFQLSDGRFQLTKGGRITTLMIGVDYVLAERRLAALLQELCASGLERTSAVIFAKRANTEHRTHDQLHIEARHSAHEVKSLPVDGHRVFLIHDQAMLVTRAVRDRILLARLPDLEFSPASYPRFG